MSDVALVWALCRQATNRRLLVEALRDEGYEVEVRRDVTDVETALAGDMSPSICIIDIDGFDVSIWRISETCARHDVPVVLLASADADRVWREASTHGVATVQQKPVQKALLKDTLRALISSP